MEKGDKGSTLTRMGVSGWTFLLVPAYPGCPGQTAIKWLLLLFIKTEKLTSNDVGAKSRVLHHQTRRSFTININEKITSHICWTNTFPVPLSVSCTFLGYINTLHPLNYVRSSGLRKQIPQGCHSALLALWWIRSLWTKTKICKRDRETDKKPRTVLHFAQLHYTDPSQ